MSVKLYVCLFFCSYVSLNSIFVSVIPWPFIATRNSCPLYFQRTCFLTSQSLSLSHTHTLAQTLIPSLYSSLLLIFLLSLSFSLSHTHTHKHTEAKRSNTHLLMCVCVCVGACVWVGALATSTIPFSFLRSWLFIEPSLSFL
jgi:hypothetical protein